MSRPPAAESLPPTPEPGASSRHRRSRVVHLVGVALTFWVALASWGLSSPTGSSPDDDFHLANIYCSGGKADCTTEGQRSYPCFAWTPMVTGDCLPQEGILPPPDIDKRTAPMGPATEPVTTGIADDRPTVYYTLVSPFTGDTLAQTSAMIRLLNAAVAVAMAMASIALTRRRLRPAVTLSWLVASVPLGAFLIASVNLSSWSIIGIAAMWGPMLTYLDERRIERRSAVRVGFVLWAALMALGARNDSSIYVLVVLVALSPLFLHPGIQRWRLVVPAGIALASLVSFVMLNSDRAGFLAGTESGAPDGVYFLITDTAARVHATVVAPLLGWLDTPMPTLVTGLTTAATAGAVLIGAGTLYRRKLLSVGLLVGLTWVLMMVLWTRTYAGVQPRYFLPLVMVFVGLMLLPRSRGRARLVSGPQAALVFVALAVANSIALLTNLWRYIHGLDGEPFTPGDLAAAATPGWWWQALPLTPWSLWALGSAAFAIALLLTWVHLYRRSPGTRVPRRRTKAHVQPVAASREVVVEIRDSHRISPSARSVLPRSVTGTQPNA